MIKIVDNFLYYTKHDLNPPILLSNIVDITPRYTSNIELLFETYDPEWHFVWTFNTLEERDQTLIRIKELIKQ